MKAKEAPTETPTAEITDKKTDIKVVPADQKKGGSTDLIIAQDLHKNQPKIQQLSIG